MNTRTPLALSLAALLLAGTTACNRNNDADGGATNTPSAEVAANEAVTGMQPTGPAVPAGTDAAMAPSQAEALALLNAVNDHEIKSAEMAKSKNVTGPVLEYANMMQAEHGKNMTDTNALMQTAGGAPADSARLNEQKAKAEAKRAQLQGMDGEAFAKAYIDAMVTDHAEALTMLDGQLIPAATDAAVRTHLTTTRQHVQQHHDRARELQTQLGATTNAATGTAPVAGQGGSTGG